ncbi:uncharacterized protein F4817DRAFT_66594 [Daldinia loculata]|uniref:uncharacterized protein n=1 Tax=Daldinia loculata TaxID=103429 RepID=UPI0020C50B18|nr:uncharacterized protein F4817DRAFT_66594 [Daldinia loculata]KAI1648493.1 hypothetical protein F4817DRAFT_66594 [Daldinia loculata]
MSANIPDRNRIIDATLQFIGDQVKNSIQSTNNDVTNLRADIDNMRFMIARMHSDIIEVMLRHERPTQRQGNHLLPDPPYLQDAREKNFLPWKLEVLTKLRVDGSAIGSEKDQFEYVLSLLATEHRNFVKYALQRQEPDENRDIGRIFEIMNDLTYEISREA